MVATSGRSGGNPGMPKWSTYGLNHPPVASERAARAKAMLCLLLSVWAPSLGLLWIGKLRSEFWAFKFQGWFYLR